MKRISSVIMLVVMVLAFAGFASAESCTSQTVVGGIIYQDVITNPIGGAEVSVTCNEFTLETISLANGAYSVVFDVGQCDYGDEVSVSAQKASLNGDNSGNVNIQFTSECEMMINVGIVHVPMVPEFGFIIGGLTIMGALGAFFIVRRK